MDKRTIKSMIIELKEEGNSFQEISNILAKQYNVKMSRQAVCGMYKRATSDEAVQNNLNLVLATTDIMNYNVIGLDKSKIKDILATKDTSISLAKINEIISENSDYKSTLYRDLLRKVSTMIKNGEDIESIKHKLSYKGELPSDKVIDSLFCDYATMEIKNNATGIIANIYNIKEDKTMIKKILKQFNIDISAKDLGQALNKL